MSSAAARTSSSTFIVRPMAAVVGVTPSPAIRLVAYDDEEDAEEEAEEEEKEDDDHAAKRRKTTP